ncbi:MAG: class I SAM-dependent methyltransferase [Acidobacteriota bacterium]|nr:class I SAM-dependent methyltransferase [Acidobacteriota bacterium]
MSGLSGRIENLSPEKRKLLAMLAKKKKQSEPEPEATAPEAVDETEIIRDDQFFSLETGVFPEKENVRKLYNAVTNQFNAGGFGNYAVFLNWGYLPNDNPTFSRVTLPENVINRNPTRLVLELIGDTPLDKNTGVLDVACGRGGTVTVFRRYFDVGTVNGLDLSNAAVAFCKKTHTWPDTHFTAGDSENLPFADESMDVVTNIESSHCYPNIEKFYSGVWRVLKPGGHFLYTDMLHTVRIPQLEQALQDLGFQIVRKRDITSNVLLSCDEIADANTRLYADGNNDNVISNFLATPDSRIYKEMQAGQQQYVMYKIKKPERGDHVG